jgi:hypothetical protein
MTSSHEPGRIHYWLGAACVVGLFVVLCDAKLYRPGDVFTITENIQIAEAQAWWQGNLDLPERKWDSALFEGRVFSHFPPMFSFLAALVTPVFHGVPHWFIVLAIVMPVPLLAFAMSRRLVRSAFWSAALAVGLVCGTSALPVLEKALRGASPYAVNQALALIGLLIFLWEYFGRGRIWVAGTGVLIAAWSRQMTLAYLLPFVWMSMGSDSTLTPAPLPEKERGSHAHGSLNLPSHNLRSRNLCSRSLIARMIGITVMVVVAIGVPMGLNRLKFGHPLEFGYRYIYEGRADDVFVRDARTHGLFSTWYVPRNLYYANLGFPEVHRIVRGEEREWYATPNDWGTGIWWTTPFLLYLFADWRRILGSPRERMLLIAAGIAYIGLMLFHGTGFDQRGLNRFSLDYLPALFALAAPGSIATPRRQWLTASMIVWSALYFAFARHMTNIRIW